MKMHHVADTKYGFGECRQTQQETRIVFVLRNQGTCLQGNGQRCDVGGSQDI